MANENDSDKQSNLENNQENINPNYEVGYKKPPRGSQFKSGQSGNRKGRPKGSLNFATVIDRELGMLVDVKENGRTKKVTKKRIIAKQMVNKAAGGDLKAAQILLNQAHLNEQTQQVQSATVSEVFTPDDQMVMASITKRIRESFVPEPVITTEPTESEVIPSPIMTLEDYVNSLPIEGGQS